MPIYAHAKRPPHSGLVQVPLWEIFRARQISQIVVLVPCDKGIFQHLIQIIESWAESLGS